MASASTWKSPRILTLALVLAIGAPGAAALLPADCGARALTQATERGCTAWKETIGDEPARDLSLALAPDGSRAYVGMHWRETPGGYVEPRYGGVAAIDADTGDLLWRTPLVEGDSTATVWLTPDGTRVVAHAGHALWTLDAATGTTLLEMPTRADALFVSPDGTRAFVTWTDTLFDEQTTRAFDLATGERQWELVEPIVHPSSLYTLFPRGAMTWVDDTLVVTAWDHLLGLDAATGAIAWRIDGVGPAQPLDLRLAPDGRIALLTIEPADTLPILYLIDPAEGTGIAHAAPMEDFADSFAIVAGGEAGIAVVGQRQQGYYGVDLATGTTLWTMPTRAITVVSLAASADGTTLHAGLWLQPLAEDPRPGGIGTIDPATGALTLGTLDVAPPEAIAVRPDGRTLLTVGADPATFTSATGFPWLYATPQAALVRVG